MVAQGVVWVDLEAAVRTWARLEGLANRRVFFGVNAEAPFPQIVLRRIGGPDEAALIQFDVWADTKSSSSETAAELATAADGLARFMTDDVVLHGAAVDSIRWFPDPESDKPRHIVDVIFTATATGS